MLWCPGEPVAELFGQLLDGWGDVPAWQRWHSSPGEPGLEEVHDVGAGRPGCDGCADMPLRRSQPCHLASAATLPAWLRVNLAFIGFVRHPYRLDHRQQDSLSLAKVVNLGHRSGLAVVAGHPGIGTGTPDDLAKPRYLIGEVARLFGNGPSLWASSEVGRLMEFDPEALAARLEAGWVLRNRLNLVRFCHVLTHFRPVQACFRSFPTWDYVLARGSETARYLRRRFSESIRKTGRCGASDFLPA